MDDAERRDRALRRLARFDRIREAAALADQAVVAERFGIDDREAARLVRQVERWDDGDEAEELILRAWVDGGDRDELVAELSRREYTFPEYAPYPFEGRLPGTWDRVVRAMLHGYLSDDEFERARGVVKPERE
ncbi:hypothetical protein [Mycolicibacterium fallax]|uniref:Uncharacterized protein n=1 Tax=Mycolicibacterium fallax TaxID=1793 RepID=A0A1X1RJ58_MYCFA|nr:hypothetical protein [Mycolicibacterium fallax]ORV07536.1 hypothetical protein AWC04_03750 [Mycolicibacterium fallax]BBY99450.1 hypothetical protein MFAL_29170 [Mycolicibacterium fallax]